METLFTLLALCAGNLPVTGEFLSQRPVTMSFDVFYDLRLIKQSWRWWFETSSRTLWRHCNVMREGRRADVSRRIVIYIPNECRLNVYQAFISSNFNYCDIVWHLCSNRSTYKIEKVHKNALRVTLYYCTSSYPDMLQVVKKTDAMCFQNEKCSAWNF